MLPVVESILFPVPEPSYDEDTGLEGLCWLPWRSAATSSEPEEVESFVGPACGLPCLWTRSAESNRVLIYFHANAEDLGMVFFSVRMLRKELGINVLAVEYPGYGLLKDWVQPSEEGIFSAATTALTYLVDEVGFDVSQVFLLGRSLGSVPASYLASRFRVGGLTLLNAFTSVQSVAEAKVGKMIAWMAFGDRFRNDVHVSKVESPLLLLHGSADQTVPPAHSEALHRLAAVAVKKLFLRPHGMTHNSSMFEDRSFVVEPMQRFFHFLLQTGDSAVPELPEEVFRPRAVRREPGGAGATASARIPGGGFGALAECGQARLLCRQRCPMVAKLEICDLTVPPGVTEAFNHVLVDDALQTVKSVDPGGAHNRPSNALMSPSFRRQVV